MDLERNIDVGIDSSGARPGATRVNRALDSIKRNVRSLANTADRQQRSFIRGFGLMRSAILAAGGAFTAGSLIGSTKEFGQAVADLSAITGATGRDLDFLRQKSKEFGETTTLSATQAAEAFKLIASAKPDLLSNVQALSQVTEQAIALAEATGDDLPTAAATLGAALNQFNVAADQSGRFINVLAAGSKFGAAQVNEVAESLKFAGTIASQANLSFEETNATIQLLSQFAIKGGEAGTQLRQIFLRLQQGADEFNPQVVGLNRSLDNLAKQNLTTSEAAKLFGSRNVAAGQILVENRDRVEQLTAALTGTGTAFEQQAARTDTLSADVLALKSAYEGLELTIGEAGVSSALRSLTQSATENIRAISRNPLTTGAVQATLNTTATAVADIKLLFDQLKNAVTETGGGAAVFEGVWVGAIDRIVRWTKFLWQQFVVNGPANLKLGITLMIAAVDRFWIRVRELAQLVGPTLVRGLQFMAVSVSRIFDGLQTLVGKAIDGIIGNVQQRLFNAARGLANLGFEDHARDITNVAIELGKAAKFTEEAEEASRKTEQAYQAEIEKLDEKVAAIRANADASREASRIAVEGAIAERDATVAAIQAIRDKRAELVSTTGGGGDDTGTFESGDNPVKKTAEQGEKALKKLGETGERVVDGLASGIADMAATGKADFSELARSIIADIIRIALRAQLLDALSRIFGGIFKGPVPSPSGGGNGLLAAGASGLDFQVGGAGGTDSKLVAFKATPGERVSVGNGRNPGSSGSIVIEQNLSLDARGADAAKIEALLPIWAERIRAQTLGDVITLRDKGVLRR